MPLSCSIHLRSWARDSIQTNVALRTYYLHANTKDVHPRVSFELPACAIVVVLKFSPAMLDYGPNCSNNGCCTFIRAEATMNANVLQLHSTFMLLSSVPRLLCLDWLTLRATKVGSACIQTEAALPAHKRGCLSSHACQRGFTLGYPAFQRHVSGRPWCLFLTKSSPAAVHREQHSFSVEWHDPTRTLSRPVETMAQ